MGKATRGRVQQVFCNSGAKLQSSTAVLRFNFCAKLKIFASIAPPSQSPKTLVAILQTNCKDKQHLTLNDEIKKNTVIDDSCHNSIFGNWFIAFIY